jgi:hypothetical protein
VSGAPPCGLEGQLPVTVEAWGWLWSNPLSSI